MPKFLEIGTDDSYRLRHLTLREYLTNKGVTDIMRERQKKSKPMTKRSKTEKKSHKEK